MSMRVLAGCVVVLAIASVACSARRPGHRDGGLTVAASFYPLEFVAGRVGGDRVHVTGLTKPGAEPHDIELSTRDVTTIVDADVVVYLRGFQPAIDKTLKEAGDHAYDVSTATSVDLMIGNAAGENGARDPHFWLDPLSVAKVADGVAARFVAADPAGKSTYLGNAVALRAELTKLDNEYRAGLTNCAGRRLVTTHAAFAYLSRAYGLTQIGISGIDPEAEPKAADIARVSDVVRKEKVTTIFFEPLVSRGAADTIAAGTGARVALLDPIEGINDTSQGRDYLAVMRSNLATLHSALGCR